MAVDVDERERVRGLRGAEDERAGEREDERNDGGKACEQGVPPQENAVRAFSTDPIWLTVEEGRDALREHLGSLEILSGVHYPRIIPDQAALAAYGRYEVACDLKNALHFANTELSLPIHPFLRDNEVEAVISACNSWTP